MTVSHVAEDRVLGGERVTDGLWTHRGKLVVNGDVQLKAGTIDTSELAGDAVQQLLGSYRGLPDYTIPATGVWYETPAQVSATTSGGLIRVEMCGTLKTGNLAGILTYVGIGTDGGITGDSLFAVQCPVANYIAGYSAVYYFTPSAGAHRFAIFLYTSGAATGFWSGGYQQLWVTEQKR